MTREQAVRFAAAAGYREIKTAAGWVALEEWEPLPIRAFRSVSQSAGEFEFRESDERYDVRRGAEILQDYAGSA